MIRRGQTFPHAPPARSSLTPPVSERHEKRTNGEGSLIRAWFGHPIQMRVSDSRGSSRSARCRGQLRIQSAAAGSSDLGGVALSLAWWASATAQASQEALGRAPLGLCPLAHKCPGARGSASAEFRARRTEVAAVAGESRREMPLPSQLAAGGGK